VAISFGGKPISKEASADANVIDVLQRAISRINAGFPKAALDLLHDATFELAESHSITLPY
jgi:hypothetical protein